MIEEMIFVSKVRNRTATIEDEISFWFKESSEHTEIIAKSIINNNYVKRQLLS